MIGTLCVTVLASLRLTEHRLHSHSFSRGPQAGQDTGLPRHRSYRSKSRRVALVGGLKRTRPPNQPPQRVQRRAHCAGWPGRMRAGGRAGEERAPQP